MIRMRLSRCVFILLILLVGACSEPKTVPPAETWPQVTFTDDTREKWARSCALCHVAGEGGAPRMGDTTAWSPRIEKGHQALMQSTVEGLNRMPPLGYCMDCSGEDFTAMINMMAGVNQ